MKIHNSFIRFLKKIIPAAPHLVGAFLLLAPSMIQAAEGDFSWAKSIGGTVDDIGQNIFVDAAGNVYTTGYFQGTDVDFDPGPGGPYLLSSAGNNDIFVTKMTGAGNLVWAKAIGGLSDDEGYGIYVDDAGNVYITGYFVGTVDFDPENTHAGDTDIIVSEGSSDIFICKLDSNGNYVNAWALGGTADDYGFGIFLDPSGNIYTTGYFKNTLFFNPGGVNTNLTSASVNVEDIFICKLNADGSFAWAEQIGGAGADVGLGISLYSAGNIYITGWFQGTNVDFDPDSVGSYLLSSSGGSYDIFVLNLDSNVDNGDFVWARRMGGVSEDVGQAVAVDSLGNVYATGWFNGAADFDEDGTNDLTSAGGPDIFISKLNSSGALMWAKGIGGTANDVGYGITVDSSGNVYTTGSFQGSNIDFDPGGNIFPLTSAGDEDIFVSKLNSGGTFAWAKAMGGASVDRGYDIFVDSAGAVYTTGFFRGTDADFDPGDGTYLLTSAGPFNFEDIFISKLEGSAATTFSWNLFLPAIIGNKQPRP